MDNEKYLTELANQQKQQKQTELDQARAKALTELEQTKQEVMPTFTKAKQQASTQSQLGAKNLAEFWARRGQTSGGISAQAELSRQNALSGTLGEIGTQEQQAATQFGQQATSISQDYMNNLANARQSIDLDLQTNLYNERQRQQELARQEKIRQEALAYQKEQDRIANAQKWTQINRSSSSSGSSSSAKPQILKGVLIPHDYAVQNQIKGVPVSSTTMRYQVGNDFVDVPKGTNPFTGTTNKDLYNDKGVLDLSKALQNTYQPNNIKGVPLKSAGATINYKGQNQKVWKTTIIDTGAWYNPFDTKEVTTYYLWDGESNKYLKLNAAEKKALGL